MAQVNSHGSDPEKRFHDASSTLTHAPTVSDHLSPSDDREQRTRLVDDLTLLQAEQRVDNQEQELRRSTSKQRSRDREPVVKEDAFNAPTPGVTMPHGPNEEDPGKIVKAMKKVKKLPRVIRYIFYLLPVTVILAIPIILGIFLPNDRKPGVGGPGGVELLWFGIWLEVVWLSLWAARIATALLPWIVSFAAKLGGSGNPRKWKAVGLQMELPTALFLWMLAVLISYFPILNSNRTSFDGPGTPAIPWIGVVNKVIIALFVLATLNFAEKILIQWIANSFHLRTYASRIETNKQSIAYLVHLYTHSKDRLVPASHVMGDQAVSGARTPMRVFQNNARTALTKVGDVANRMAGDFTGREVRLSNHPRKVVSELLRNTSSAHVLARRLFRTYAKGETLLPADLRPAFPSDEEADAAFAVFDRDLNGDVSMEELEAFCDEVHREKKAIDSSLKDLESVILKLDRVFLVIVIIIAVIVFISIISSSAAAALTSAGTVILGLAWVLQATAQEFLQSIIFVFVKHPFDVGDRVTVYGNTGAAMMGDDYYVTEISLLYTEFKKMEGHIVQAPNYLLNNLFILNHRRSNALADVFELKMKHGTPVEVIDELQARMTEFVLENRRDFNGKILTELRSIENSCTMKLNFICFHKSSFQNELLRLTRHNKFARHLMKQMVELGIEQPRPQYQVSGRDYPIFQTNVPAPAYNSTPQNPPDPALFTATRRRADSAASPDTDMDFQDVWSSRRQNNPQFNFHSSRIPEESGDNNTSLDRMTSRTSQPGSSRSHFLRSMTFRKSTDQHDRDRDIV